MNDFEALDVLKAAAMRDDGLDRRFQREAIDHIAARLRGEGAQGEQQSVAVIHLAGGVAGFTTADWSYLRSLPPGTQLYTRPQPAAPQPTAVDGCHCATCTCSPGMTPSVRFDLSSAQQEGAVRDHLIRLGWTPPAAVDGMADFEIHAGGEYFASVCGPRERTWKEAMHYVSTLRPEDGEPEVFEVIRRKVDIAAQPGGSDNDC